MNEMFNATQMQAKAGFARRAPGKNGPYPGASWLARQIAFGLAVFAIGVCTVTAKAAEEKVVSPEWHDPNGDHRISFDEFVHVIGLTAFKRMDVDGNGVLTPNEVRGDGEPDHAESILIDLSQSDTDGDGHLALDEVKAAVRAHTGVHALFQRLDKDGSNDLTESELRGMHGVPLINFQW